MRSQIIVNPQESVMLRKSHLLAVVAVIATAGSLATPASAKFSSSAKVHSVGSAPHFGPKMAGSRPHGTVAKLPPHIQPSPAGSKHPGVGTRPIGNIAHLPGSTPVAKGPGTTKIPANDKVAHLPPYEQPTKGPATDKIPPGGGVVKLPQGPVTGPGPGKLGGGVDNVCPFNPSKCTPKPPGTGTSNNGPNPQVPGGQTMPSFPIGGLDPIEMPSIQISNDGPGAVAQDSGPAVTPVAIDYAAQRCGSIPRLAELLDQSLATAQLPASDLATVTAQRATIANLATANKIGSARGVEEQAMKILGYQKVWLRCGRGTFAWERVTG
jgi:hypothetical protein